MANIFPLNCGLDKFGLDDEEDSVLPVPPLEFDVNDIGPDVRRDGEDGDEDI